MSKNQVWQIISFLKLTDQTIFPSFSRPRRDPAYTGVSRQTHKNWRCIASRYFSFNLSEKLGGRRTETNIVFQTYKQKVDREHTFFANRLS